MTLDHMFYTVTYKSDRCLWKESRQFRSVWSKILQLRLGIFGSSPWVMWGTQSCHSVKQASFTLSRNLCPFFPFYLGWLVPVPWILAAFPVLGAPVDQNVTLACGSAGTEERCVKSLRGPLTTVGTKPGHPSGIGFLTWSVYTIKGKK